MGDFRLVLSAWQHCPDGYFTLLSAAGSFIILYSFSEVKMVHWDFQP